MGLGKTAVAAGVVLRVRSTQSGGCLDRTRSAVALLEEVALVWKLV